MVNDPFYDFDALPQPSGNPWATTTISRHMDDLGIFITDERSGRTEAVESRSLEGVGVQSRFIVPDSAPTDPDFASVSLLLHMDGSDGSTTFTDSSSNALTVTANGNAQISTANPKLGTGSLLLDGTGDYLSVTSAGFGFGTGDFTIEAWIKIESLPININTIAARGSSFGASSTWRLHLSSSGNIFFRSFNVHTATWAGATIGVWHHIAVTRNSGFIRIYANGSRLIESAESSGNTIGSTGAIGVGAYADGSNAFAGEIDEFRVTKGVARYTGATYTIPTAAFPDS